MHGAPHDDLHDRGLAFDLVTLRARRWQHLPRRQALKLLAGAGAGIVLVACGSDGEDGSSTTTSASGTPTTRGSSEAVDAIPEETGGPFPGDGTNGPNVLVEEGIVRQDIRSSFGRASGTAEGLPLNIALQLVDASSGAPKAGAALYVWHCTREGGYSLYSQGVADENFLRGVQVADADGLLAFTSVYPGAYSGRWPHIHFEVFDDLDAATSGRPIVTSQLALPEGASREVYLTSGYEQSLSNLSRSSLESDMVFRDDGAVHQLATVDGDPTQGYTATLVVGV